MSNWLSSNYEIPANRKGIWRLTGRLRRAWCSQFSNKTTTKTIVKRKLLTGEMKRKKEREIERERERMLVTVVISNARLRPHRMQ